jgi:hypothetical protein
LTACRRDGSSDSSSSSAKCGIARWLTASASLPAGCETAGSGLAAADSGARPGAGSMSAGAISRGDAHCRVGARTENAARVAKATEGSPGEKHAEEG